MKISLGVTELRRKILCLALSLLVLFQTSCSFFAPDKQDMTVESYPAGASVFYNGKPLPGKTPLSWAVDLGFSQENEFRFEKPGYYPATLHTKRHLSKLGILDVIGGVIFVIPFAGLFAPGAFRETLPVANLTVVEEGSAPSPSAAPEPPAPPAP